MPGRPVAKHVLAVEQVAVMVPHLLACRAPDPLRHELRELRLRYEDHNEWKEGDACACREHAEEAGDDVLGLYGVLLRLGPVSFPSAKACDPAHACDVSCVPLAAISEKSLSALVRKR